MPMSRPRRKSDCVFVELAETALLHMPGVGDARARSGPSKSKMQGARSGPSKSKMKKAGGAVMSGSARFSAPGPPGPETPSELRWIRELLRLRESVVLPLSS
jgi:hypothetical protein